MTDTWNLLIAAGLTEDTARELIDSYEPERIREVVHYCCVVKTYGPRGIVRALAENWELIEYDRDEVVRLLEA